MSIFSDSENYSRANVKGVYILRLHFIYIFIGISTLVLNLVLTLRIIGRQRDANLNEIRDCNDVITFNLTRGRSIEGATTSAAPYDDTVRLE